MNEFKDGELIIYQNGDRYEIGKIKRIVPGGAFVWYHEGDTAAKTPFDCMHKLANGYTIKKTSLGGDMDASPAAQPAGSFGDMPTLREA